MEANPRLSHVTPYSLLLLCMPVLPHVWCKTLFLCLQKACESLFGRIGSSSVHNDRRECCTSLLCIYQKSLRCWRSCMQIIMPLPYCRSCMQIIMPLPYCRSRMHLMMPLPCCRSRMHLMMPLPPWMLCRLLFLGSIFVDHGCMSVRLLKHSIV